METPIIIIFAIIGVSVLLFVTEIMPIDKIAFFIIVALLALNLISPEESISGFSNPATITVLMLMIIAIGLEDNGVIKLLSDNIKRLSALPFFLMLPVFMLISAIISAFISTTAVVIIFIKIITQLSEKYNLSASKLLMPISFAGILGGSCTLMGTSTNLLVNSVAKQYGMDGFAFFEFAVFGLILLIVGILFMTVASKWLPKGNNDNLRAVNDQNDFLFTLTLKPKSQYVGRAFSNIPFAQDPDINVLKLIRGDTVNTTLGKHTTLRAGDELVIMTELRDFSNIPQNDFILSLKSNEISKNMVVDKNLTETFIEALILPGSEFIDKSLEEVSNLLNNLGKPIGIQKKKMLRIEEKAYLNKVTNNVMVKSGDRLIIKTNKNQLRHFYDYDNVVILREHEDNFNVNSYKRIWSIIVLLSVIVLVATSTLTILAGTIMGVGALLLGNCINLNKIYKRVNWQIIFLLAGMIPLGIAMGNTGADQWISRKLLYLLSEQEPVVVLGFLFGLTMFMSGFISNNATAIILTPIAIALATGLQLPLKPFVIAVMFGANFSFFTPVGYQTNTLIYGTGVYKFKHFFFVGGLLSILILIVGTLLLSTLL